METATWEHFKVHFENLMFLGHSYSSCRASVVVYIAVTGRPPRDPIKAQTWARLNHKEIWGEETVAQGENSNPSIWDIMHSIIQSPETQHKGQPSPGSSELRRNSQLYKKQGLCAQNTQPMVHKGQILRQQAETPQLMWAIALVPMVTSDLLL